MRPGICLAAFGDRTLPEAVAAVRALGIEVIDLPTESMMHLLQLGRDIQAIADVVHRALKDSGLKIGCVSNSRVQQSRHSTISGARGGTDSTAPSLGDQT